MTKRKSLHNSRSPEEEAKTRAWYEYLNMHTFQLCPSADGHKKRLALAWVLDTKNNKDVCTEHHFALEQGIPVRTWDDWTARDEDLKLAKVQVKEIIAQRNEKGALNEGWNANIVRFINPHYAKRWRDREVDQAKIQAKEFTEQLLNKEDIKDFVKAALNKVSTDLVPERPKKKKS